MVHPFEKIGTIAKDQLAGCESNGNVALHLTEKLALFGLLVLGCIRRELLGRPARALFRQILLPISAVAFFSLLASNAPARDVWPVFAGGGVVWLLFANNVVYGGMVIWHERRLLRQGAIPAWLLLAAAAVVPMALFGVHLSLVHLGLLAGSSPRGGALETLAAGGIATASGLGAGVLSARITELRPGFVSALPKLLLASLILTPVFYRPSALDNLEQGWCLVNPLCVATELARAGLAIEADALPRNVIVAVALSGAVLCWGLSTLRGPATRYAEEDA